MRYIALDTWHVTIEAADSLGESESQQAATSFDARLGRALAVIEDELRTEFGDVGITRDRGPAKNSMHQ